MRSVALTVALLLLIPAVAFAQGGRVSGKVTDEAGDPLAGVEARLLAVDGSADVSKTSTKKGRFSLAVVHPDREYEIILTKDGFQTIREAIKLKRGEPVQGTWVMTAGGADGAPGLNMTPEEIEARKAAVDLYNEGARALNEGDLETASAKFDAALAEAPDLYEAYEVAAALNFRLENYDRATELADSILTRDPVNERALAVRYDSYNALGKETEAGAALDALIAAAPSDDTARRVYNRALARAKTGDVEASIPRLEQAVALAPGLAPAWGLLGDLEIALGNHQRAIECGDRLMEIEGSLERGLSLRHRAFEAMGDDAGAAEALRALAELTPDAVLNSLFERGEDLFDSNEPVAAAKIYRQVLDLQPDNARAHYKLGLALLSAEDSAGAKTHLERFLELAPDDPEAQAARDMLSYLQ